MKITHLSLALTAFFCGSSAFAAPATISVQVDRPAHKISPMLWGLFFEDINLSVDGGLYPELVRNRSFEGSDHLRYWTFTPAAGEAEPTLDDGAQGKIKVELLDSADAAPGPVETSIHLSGLADRAGPARAIVLTSENPEDENSFEDPHKVAPRTEEFTLAGPRFTRSFPGNSFTVLRLPTR